MIYKLYKDKTTLTGPETPEVFEEFHKIYEANDVKIIGVWRNNEVPGEFYFMTAYRDDDHYNDFVEKMKSDERYQELSNELGKNRESIEVVNLIDAYQ